MSPPNSAVTNSEAPTGAALALYDERQQVVLRTAIELWSVASTGIESRRREEVLKNKLKVVQSFFDWVSKNPGQVEPTYVRAWCERMRDGGKSPATVCARVASLSSFYRRAMSQPAAGYTDDSFAMRAWMRHRTTKRPGAALVSSRRPRVRAGRLPVFLASVSAKFASQTPTS